ncbi:MAG TPA: S8 family peptidase [Lachnospiraceae bacterium]|nr:S8 family peptidase [Lachnospiraceae bacterium]
MDNQKLENILNLALNTPEDVRVKSLNLNVGYTTVTRTWELIVKYNGDLSRILQLGIQAEPLLAGYAILTVPENLVDEIAKFTEIEYVEKPKRLFFAVQASKETSCIIPVTNREPYLTGEGVIIAIIDSGIDFTSKHFRNADGTTRILFLWDQTITPDEELGRRPPEGFIIGTEFNQEQINEALNAENRIKRMNLIPSIDVSGHGTAVAGIAAGSGGGPYEGVAKNSDLIVVKLGIPDVLSFPRTTELMRAITYVVKKAQQLGKPISVNLSFGNTYGPHDGSSLLERFIDNASEVGKNVICVGSGNEGASGGHSQGNLLEGENTVPNKQTFAELSVGNYEAALSVQLWKNYVDTYRVSLRSPGGEVQVLPLDEPGKQTFRMEQTDILIYMGEPTPYSVTQEIYFDLIPVDQYITPGIWIFTLEGIKIETGQYYFYLPSSSILSQDTRFVIPSPQVTLTIPSTSGKVITVGAYDSLYESYADFSGRGYVYPERTMGLVAAGAVKPDLVAPGVSIAAPDTLGGYGFFTGTSFAVPFVTGAAALLMEWGDGVIIRLH